MASSLFARLDDEVAAAAAARDLDDDALLGGVDEARAAHEETLGEYVSGAVRRFARLATDEEYVTFRTRLERAGDPERAALGAILAWSVRRDLAGAAHYRACHSPAHDHAGPKGADDGNR